MNDDAAFEVRVVFRARVLCRTAEPHAFESRPCAMHAAEARRQLTSPAVASPAPARGSAGRSGAGNGAAGRVSGPPSDQAGAPPSNEHRPVAANDEPAEWASVVGPIGR